MPGTPSPPAEPTGRHHRVCRTCGATDVEWHLDHPSGGARRGWYCDEHCPPGARKIPTGQPGPATIVGIAPPGSSGAWAGPRGDR